jgi:hypothetical protein
MDSPSALRVFKVLRATLQCVEESGIAPPDSSELDHLKRQVIRAVSELELQKTVPPEMPIPEMPLVVLRMR